MKNITVSLDDEIYRRARIRAAERDTSVSALVRDFLVGLGVGETESEMLKGQERALRKKIKNFRAADRVSRDALHERGRYTAAMAELRFLDTSILLYSISQDRTESKKRDRAIALLDEDNWALSVQVLQEFYVQATRPTRDDAIPHAIATGLIRSWLRFPVQEITLPTLTGALEIKEAYGFSYWDSAIFAAARALGCGALYSEDLTQGRVVEGVTIVNPFR